MSVGLSAFQAAGGYTGPGIASRGDVEELSKALEAGYQIGTGLTGGSALRVQSLEQSLKVLTFNSNHVKLWKKIHKSPAFSTVEEYNQLTDYGGNAFPFVQEGELPQASDSSYVRRTQLVKFLGTVREVTHQATLVHPAHGDLIAQENHNGILYLMNQIENFLFSGDSSLAFDGEAEQFDGLDALIDSTSVIDLEGASLQETDLEEASQTVLDNYGYPTDLFLGLRAQSDLQKSLFPRQRIQMPYPQNGKVGLTVASVLTSGGEIELNPNIFIKKTPNPRAAATSANAPATPASIAGAVAGVSNGDWNKSHSSGDTNVAYLVTACNRFGESAPTAVLGAVVTINQTQKNNGNAIALTITNPAVIGAFAPEYFRIYRSVGSSSTSVPSAVGSYYLVMQVPASSQAAGGTTVVNDVNLTLPNTSVAYMGQMDASVLTFRQLMPMMKMDLAVLGPAYRWMILLYGTPVLFAPKKWLRILNVGELSAR